MGFVQKREMLRAAGRFALLGLACLTVAGCSSAVIDDQDCNVVMLQSAQPAVTYDRYSRDGVTRHVLQHSVPAAGPALMNDC